MFKRKLFKRALPIILSVAMVFQSMPATAMAAEDPAAVVQEADDTAETTTAEEVQPEADTSADGAQQSEETPDTAAASEGSSESVPETTAAQETSGESVTDPAAVPEGTDAGTAVSESGQEETTAEEVQEAQADLAAQIVIDEEALERALTSNLSYKDGVVSGDYTPDTNLFDSFVNADLKNGNAIISVKVGDETNANLKDRLSFKWFKDTTNMSTTGDTPKNAGRYRLEIKLEAVDGLCSAADASIDFEIKQAELELAIGDVKMPEIDTTIADFEKDFQENYVLVNPKEYEQDENGNDVNVKLNKDTYVDSIAITVKDAVSGTAITDKTAKFEKGKDYSYTVSVVLKDTNYTVKDLGVQDIKLQGDIVTEMEVTLSRNIEYTYGDEVKLPAAGTDYTVKVLYEEDGEKIDVNAPADSIAAKWLDADGNEIESPSDAGTYYVLLTYTDGTGRYKECDNRVTPGESNGRIMTSIPVIINPVSVYVKPKLTKTEYTDGKTAADILYDVAYDIFTTKDNTALKTEEFDQKTGWGVSYNQDGMTQYYEPVFVLEAAALQLDDDGNPMKDETGKLVYGDYEAVANDARLVSGEEFKYRIVFSGKKAVYDYQDDVYDYDRASEVDVNEGTNSAVVNYKVDVSSDTLDKNFVDVTITKTNAVIDVSKYTECTNGVWKKIFDYEPFYEERANYKKATVDGSDKGLSYRWYNAYKDEKTGKYEQGEDELYDFQYTYENGDLREAVSPIEAGTYMLVISYRDPAHEKAAEDVQLIYEIEPQKIAAEVATGTEGNKVTAYSGTSVGEFAGELADTITKVVKKAENNDLGKLAEDEILGLWEYGEQYELVPVIERQDNIDANVWKAVDINETFIEGGHYRLAFGVYIIDDYALGAFFRDNYQSFKTEETEDGTEVIKYNLSNYVDITVEKMGTTPLELKVDTLGTMTKVYDGTPFAVPAEAIKVYNKNTGELVTDIALQYTWQDMTAGEEVDEAINGGKYTLYASFSGDAVYAPLDKTMVGKANGFEITKRSISVKPLLVSKIEAGLNSTDLQKIVQYASDYDEFDETYVDVYGVEVTGDILDTETVSDVLAFSPIWYDEYGYKHVGYMAIQSYGFKVLQADGTTVSDSVLKAEQGYYVVPDITLRSPYSRNYEVTNNKAEFTPDRVGASVFKHSTFDGADLTGIPATSLKDFMGNDDTDSKVITHTIVPREGIPFVLAGKSGIKDDKDKNVGGNLFVFKIQAPKEFFTSGAIGKGTTASFAPVFENAIKDNGGYVLTTEAQAKQNGYIIAAFKTEGKDEKPSFTVRWSDGYLEKFTVDFTKAVLEDDLTKAVKPKSLAFNSPVTKMVVGGKQQLDVKITKAKLDDVICLKYQTLTENSTVLSVSETGAVVALAVGSETVQAIPCYLDEDGEKQPIDGAKAATVKISVVDVTAPKIKAVTALDTTATVTYPEITDGYRREIYVLENLKAKETDFTEAIGKLKNGDWKAAGFAIAPVYVSNEYDPDIKLSKVSLERLTANTQYTVYVRNVSGIRKLADGSSVVDSAKGAVKSFKTTASQVLGMQIRFDEKYWDDTWSDYFYDYSKGIGAYVVDVSEKKIPSLTVGMFWENAKNTSANQDDIIEYPLPLDKAELAYYAQPKLSYFAVSNMDSYRDEPDSWYTLKIQDRYYHPSNIAKVDKKGNVTLTGEGWVDLVVYDSVTGRIGGGRLYISATATKMTVAKKANIRVGETLDLANCVTYFAEKQKLTSYWSNLRITDIQGDTDAFTIAYDAENPGYPRYIIAKEPKKSITVEVTDIAMESDNVGKITISSKDIEAVKNLKVTEAVDKYATVSFTYPASAFEYADKTDTEVSANQLYFRIQILDAAKNVVSDKYYHSWYDEESDDGKGFDGVQYDYKKKLYTFTKYIGMDRPLNRKSAYTVSVTATYLKNEVSSKPASKGFKTTDIPAAYQYEYCTDTDGDGYIDGFYPYSTAADSPYKCDDGGAVGIEIGNVGLWNYPTLTSNNTYTLVAWPQNQEAKNRLSDTLTWKSTNTKVATVKANAGSYTATLKALKKGTTRIELTSKITKKIVARYTVFVNAAGEASYYFGDWEPDEDNTLVGGVENGEIELLTMNNPVKARLEVGEGKMAKFVAPEYGAYAFWSDGSMMVYRIDDEGELQRDSSLTNNYSSTLRKGEVRYVQVVNTNSDGEAANITIRAYGTIYEIWSGVGEYTLKEAGSIAFTAPEDNYYTVKDSEGQDVRTIGAMKAGETKVISNLSAGKYTVTKRETAGNTFDEKGLTKQNIEAKTTKWYVFAPTYDMEFTLGITGKGLRMSIYEDITSEDPEVGSVESAKVSLKSGEKRYIAVTNGSLDAIETDITVKAEAERGTVNGTTSVELKAADEGKYVLYRIPADGYYRFKVSATQIGADKKEVPADVSAYYAENTDGYIDDINSVSEKEKFEKDQLVYVYVTSTDATEENAVTVKIDVTEIKVDDISTGEQTKTLSSDYSYYKFTATQDGKYTFKVDITPRTGEDAVTPSAQLNSYKGKTFDINSFVYGDTYSLKNGETVYLRVNTDDTENKTDEAKITVSKLEAEAFTDKKVVELADGETKWIQFKAPQDTLYYFVQETKQAEDGKGTVDVYYHTALGDDNGSDIGLYGFSEYHKAGEYFYLELTASGGKVTYTITATPIVPGSVPATDIQIKAGYESWYAFTAPATARYKVELTGTDAPLCTMKMYTSLDGRSNPVAIVSETVLQAGQTVYYVVQNPESTNKTVKVSLNITQLSVEALDTSAAGKTADLKVDGINSIWYSFTADKAGRYSFNAEAKAEEGKTASASIKYYKDAEGEEEITGINSNPEKAVFVKANDKIYIKVSVSGADATVTTTVKAITPTTIPADGKTETNIAKDSYVWYELKGEGIYTIATSDLTENGSLTIWGVRNSENNFVQNPSDVTLGKSDVYTIVVKADTDKLGYKLTAEKRDVKDLTIAEPVKGSLKTGEDLYVSFKAPEQGRYAVSLNGLADDVASTMTVTGGGNKIQPNGKYCSFVSDINDVVTFKINVTSEASVNFNVEAEVVNPEDITANGAATVKVAETPAGYVKWYAYTAAATGKYVVKVSDPTAQVRYANKLTDGFTNSNGTLNEVTFTKGETYYYALYYNTKPEKDVTFSITKATANELTTEYTVDVSKIIANEKTYVSFKAPADGRYVFTCDNENVNAYVYADIDNLNNGNILSFGADRPMKAGEELVFAVFASAVPDKNFKISVSSVEFKALSVSTAEAPKPVTEELATDEALWLSFTGTETAKYLFSMTNVGYVEVYNKMLGEYYDKMIYPDGILGVDNGQTVYLKLYPDQNATPETSGKIKVSISASVDTKMTKLSEGANQLTDIPTGESWAYFTAETAGFYTFETEGDCDVSVYKDMAGASSVQDKYALGKGESVYFAINNYTGNVATETITIEKVTEIKELVIGGSGNNVHTDDFGYAYYVLTAPEKGTYYITANNGNMYTGDMPDAINNGAGSAVRLSLDKDQVKYIKVYTAVQDCVVTCTKAAEKVLTSEKPVRQTMQKTDAILVKWTAEDDGYYRIKRTDNDTSMSQLFLGYVKGGQEKEFLVTVQNDATKVEVSVEPVKVKAISGAGSSDLGTIKSGESLLVEWTAEASGAYKFGIQSDGAVTYSYYPYGLNGSSYSYDSWTVEKGNKFYAFIQSTGKNAKVTFSATKVERELPADSSSVFVSLAANESDTFTFTAPSDNTYMFCSEGAWYKVDGVLEVVGSNTRAAAYGRESGTDFNVKQRLNKGQTVRLTVTNRSSNSNRFEVRLYTISEIYGGILDQSIDPMYYSVNLNKGQEYWYSFYVDTAGWYKFNTDSYSQMKLYAGNADGEVLVDDYTNSIKVWLEEGSVLLKTYGDKHNATSYTLTVAAAQVQTIERQFDIGDNNYVNVSDAQQLEIQYTYTPSEYETKTKISFNSTNQELNWKLYLGDSSEPVQTWTNATTVEYEVSKDDFNTIKLVIWADQYGAFYDYISSSGNAVECEYTDIAIGSTQDVTIPRNGKTTVVYQSVSEAGRYEFAGNYDAANVIVSKNDDPQSADSEEASGFKYTLDLTAGDVIKVELTNENGYEPGETISLESKRVVVDVTEDETLAASSTTLTIIADPYTTKTVTYTVEKAGKYVFTASATDTTNNQFILTVNGTDCNEWGTATTEAQLEANSTITFKLWNTNKDSAEASLQVTYTDSTGETNSPTGE